MIFFFNGCLLKLSFRGFSLRKELLCNLLVEKKHFINKMFYTVVLQLFWASKTHQKKPQLLFTFPTNSLNSAFIHIFPCSVIGRSEKVRISLEASTGQMEPAGKKTDESPFS